jgi:hypothetical protein
VVPFQHRGEERPQIGQVELRNLVAHLLEVEARAVADKIPDGLQNVLAAEAGGPLVKPFGQALRRDGRRVREQLPEEAWGSHPQHQLEQILGLVHHRAERPDDLVDLRVELVPDAGLDGRGIPERVDIDLPGLSVAVHPADALVEAHGVPREINVN